MAQMDAGPAIAALTRSSFYFLVHSISPLSLSFSFFLEFSFSSCSRVSQAGLNLSNFYPPIHKWVRRQYTWPAPYSVLHALSSTSPRRLIRVQSFTSLLSLSLSYASKLFPRNVNFQIRAKARQIKWKVATHLLHLFPSAGTINHSSSSV